MPGAQRQQHQRHLPTLLLLVHICNWAAFASNEFDRAIGRAWLTGVGTVARGNAVLLNVGFAFPNLHVFVSVAVDLAASNPGH